MSVFLILRLSSTERPLSHSVATLLDAIADPHPNVLNFDSVITPLSSTCGNNRNNSSSSNNRAAEAIAATTSTTKPTKTSNQHNICKHHHRHQQKQTKHQQQQTPPPPITTATTAAQVQPRASAAMKLTKADSCDTHVRAETTTTYSKNCPTKKLQNAPAKKKGISPVLGYGRGCFWSGANDSRHL